MSIYEIIGLFVFLYPLYMSIVWMIGGIIFCLRREGKADPGLEYFPYFTVIVPGHNEEQVIEQINPGQIGSSGGEIESKRRIGKGNVQAVELDVGRHGGKTNQHR